MLHTPLFCFLNSSWIMILNFWLFHNLMSGLRIMQFACMIAAIWPLMELDHPSINLKGIVLLFFVYRYHIIYSFGAFSCLAMNILYVILLQMLTNPMQIPVVTWQALCLWEFCRRWFVEYLGLWKGMGSAFLILENHVVLVRTAP